MKKIIFLFLILLINNIANGNNNIVYLDIQFIIDNSNLGKNYKEILLDKQNKIKSDLKTETAIIKSKEKEINNQKNILKKDELNNKIKELNELIKNYQLKRNKFNEEISKDKKNYSNKILQILNPILTNYVEENNISLVVEKKNILVGVKTLDITNKILLIFNEEIKKNKLINEN